jgi:hypothetical protein
MSYLSTGAVSDCTQVSMFERPACILREQKREAEAAKLRAAQQAVPVGQKSWEPPPHEAFTPEMPRSDLGLLPVLLVGGGLAVAAFLWSRRKRS